MVGEWGGSGWSSFDVYDKGGPRQKRDAIKNCHWVSRTLIAADHLAGTVVKVSSRFKFRYS